MVYLLVHTLQNLYLRRTDSPREIYGGELAHHLGVDLIQLLVHFLVIGCSLRLDVVLGQPAVCRHRGELANQGRDYG